MKNKLCGFCGQKKTRNEFELKSSNSVGPICDACWLIPVVPYVHKMFTALKARQHHFGAKLNFSFREFYYWLQTTRFPEIYKTYLENKRLRRYAPCVDRICNVLDYRLGNIQIITVPENSSKNDCNVIASTRVGNSLIKNLRVSRGYSRKEMALALNLPLKIYERLEEKAHGSTLEILFLLKRKLNLSWEELGLQIEQAFREANVSL